MNQPEQLMPGISGGGSRTVVASDVAHNVVFSTVHHGPLLIVTPDGQLSFKGLAKEVRTEALAEMLVEAFGRAYSSHLFAAEAKVKDAEGRARRAEAALGGEKARADKAERDLKHEKTMSEAYSKRARTAEQQLERLQRKVDGVIGVPEASSATETAPTIDHDPDEGQTTIQRIRHALRPRKSKLEEEAEAIYDGLNLGQNGDK
jgi:hypothetical protein